jgi:hypothetical protein
MKTKRSEIILIAGLTLLSIFIYLIQNAIFHNPHDTVYYLLGDLAFIPVQVIVVTLVIDKLVNYVEKKNNAKRINVIISSFFTESGTELMSAMSRFSRNQEDLCKILSADDFSKNISLKLKKQLKAFPYDIYADPAELAEMKSRMSAHKPYMLRMLENTNLMEHDSFTDMLWSVFHVADELDTRNLGKLSKADIDHISYDILRAYSALNLEWIGYMDYLEREYPYLFVLAIRKSPFKDYKACTEHSPD